MSVTDDGERVYVAGTTAGFYMLDTEAIAHHKDAELAAGTAGCNTALDDRRRPTASSTPSRLAALANDCMHMVVNNDPGLKAFLASNASAAGQGRALSGAADALAVRRLSAGERDADRHAQRRLRAQPAGAGEGQHQGTARLRLADRRERRLPAQLRADGVGGIGDHADHGRRVRDSRQPDRASASTRRTPSRTAARRRQVAQQNHNPTVFKNLVFNTWYGHGLRAIDISDPA